jgi:hypothetical protein
METQEVIILGFYLLLGPLVFLPSLAYMGDKINRLSSLKWPGIFYIVGWFAIPFLYFSIWRNHKGECSPLPLWICSISITIILLIAIFK